mmetsp:Transcript_12243/g.39394  ORF Transcript_12243/g.39394 Transcript_12243/m.39394 type:complete len:249 (-) Transcript_12243:2649-3395(-)
MRMTRRKIRWTRTRRAKTTRTTRRALWWARPPLVPPLTAASACMTCSSTRPCAAATWPGVSARTSCHPSARLPPAMRVLLAGSPDRALPQTRAAAAPTPRRPQRQQTLAAPHLWWTALCARLVGARRHRPAASPRLRLFQVRRRRKNDNRSWCSYSMAGRFLVACPSSRPSARAAPGLPPRPLAASCHHRCQHLSRSACGARCTRSNTVWRRLLTWRSLARPETPAPTRRSSLTEALRRRRRGATREY